MARLSGEAGLTPRMRNFKTRASGLSGATFEGDAIPSARASG